MSRICAVVPILNQHEIAHKCLELLMVDNSPEDFEILVIDGGSDVEFHSELSNVTVIRFDEPIGVYPTFKIALENTRADILAFFHSDLFVENPRWWHQIEGAFKGDSRLGLIGTVGSKDWGFNGGRGRTDMSFQGKIFSSEWKGSTCEDNRADNITGGLRNSVVLDGCSMIFRRECLSSLPLDEWSMPHHFYDRVLCAMTLQSGWKIATLGIECDHISGQTANKENKYQEFGKKWAFENLEITEPNQWIEKHRDWVNNSTNPSRGITEIPNWDQLIYQEAQRRFLLEYRDKRHVLPVSV
jgi:glycosyltransferase involved in cell wall biosynthesis